MSGLMRPVRIAFDIGGVISKYPAIMRAMSASLLAGGAEVYVITDMADRVAVVDLLAANGFSHIPSANVRIADYVTHGDGCKAEILRKLEIDVFFDDLIGYVAAGGCPVRCLVMPDASKPYYADDWATTGSMPDFGRTTYKVDP